MLLCCCASDTWHVTVPLIAELGRAALGGGGLVEDMMLVWGTTGRSQWGSLSLRCFGKRATDTHLQAVI